MNRRANVVGARLSQRPPQRRSLEMPAGAFTLASTLNTVVSVNGNGPRGFQKCVIAFHGAALRPPRSPNYYPAKSVVEWHVREVFQGPEGYKVPA
jgi:putative restriction endonuclease